MRSVLGTTGRKTRGNTSRVSEADDAQKKVKHSSISPVAYSARFMRMQHVLYVQVGMCDTATRTHTVCQYCVVVVVVGT